MPLVTMLYMLLICPLLGVSGYVAAGMYKKMEGERWVWNINLTSCLFAGKSLHHCKPTRDTTDSWVRLL